MKNVMFLIIATAFLVTWESCSDADASMSTSKTPPDLATQLNELGFTNVGAIKRDLDKEKEIEYFRKTGLSFISTDSLIRYVQETGFNNNIAENFKGEIPTEARIEILKNYKKLSAIKHYYTDAFWNETLEVGKDHWGATDGRNRKGIWVVAPPEMFIANPPRKDPMAIVLVDRGWLVLAKW